MNSNTPPCAPVPSVLTSAPPITTTSKRHSLNISTTGPRPLQLVNGNVHRHSGLQKLQGPATAPILPAATPFQTSPSPVSETSTPPSGSPNINGFQTIQPRRQSSISYNPRDKDANRSPLGNSSRHTIVRSSSLGLKSPPNRGRGLMNGGGRSNTASTSNLDRPEAGNRSPLTLAEKHAELLHFIAQKESKCLELRSQLAIHEAELLQLKRKWERIVSRGFERSNLSNDDATLSNASGGQGGAMLEGLKEGVQGVSRFIAAGLAMGELPPSPLSASPQTSTTRPSRPSHLTKRSNSSVSTTTSITTTTKSTRLSQSSSASSVHDEPTTLTSEETSPVLMVHDTGATPTMSPNPAFIRKRQEDGRSLRSNSQAEDELSSLKIEEAKMRYQKSQDAPVMQSPKASTVSTSPVSVESARLKQTANRKRSSYGSAFSPISSITGLGALTAGAASQPMSSWVGSVGKKWEDLQQGSTFSKSSRRASSLISDVSQSIAHALAPPPPLSSSTPSPSLTLTSPLPSSTTTLHSSLSSLLDDDYEASADGLACVMTPDPVPSVASTQTTSSKSIMPAANAVVPLSQTTQLSDDDDEWNW